MKRAVALLLFPVLLVLTDVAAATAQSSHESGLLSITFAPRPGGNDEILLCTDHDFQSREEAITFGQTLAPKLGFGPGIIRFDTVDYKDCVRLTPDHRLSFPGPRSHERTFRFDGTRVLDAARRQFHLDVLNVSVCVPSLPSIVSPTPEDSLVGGCEHPLDHEDDWFSNETGSVPLIEVRFRATPASLLFGIIGDAAFWTLAAGILFLVARRLRRKGWRFFIRHRFLAWILNVVLMLVLLFGAVFIAPYWSGYIQSLQMYLHIGVPGEAVLVTVPTLVLCGVMIVGPIRATRRHRPLRVPDFELITDTRNAAIPRLASEKWDARTITYFVAGVVPFLAFVVLTNNVPAGNVVHGLFLALAALFLLGDALWLRLRLWSTRGRDETSRLTLVRSELASLGAHVSHGYVAEHLFVGDAWLPQPGRFTPVSLFGRSMTVWKRIQSQPPAVLTGAAIDSLGLNGEWLAVPFFLVDATLGETGPHHLGRGWVFSAFVIGAILLVRMALAIFKRLRLVRAAARSPRAVFYLRGLLLRRWIAARRVAPRQQYTSRFLAQRQPAVQIWRGALKSADRFMAKASISRDRLEPMVQEVMSTDLG